MARSIAKACLRLTGLFEAELLTELLLRFWNHPRANDAQFRTSLLEGAAEALQASVGGEQLFEDLKPQNVNFVAAIWYAESMAVFEREKLPIDELESRQQWLNTITKALPSCFCDPELLG